MTDGEDRGKYRLGTAARPSQPGCLDPEVDALTIDNGHGAPTEFLAWGAGGRRFDGADEAGGGSGLARIEPLDHVAGGLDTHGDVGFPRVPHNAERQAFAGLGHLRWGAGSGRDGVCSGAVFDEVGGTVSIPIGRRLSGQGAGRHPGGRFHRRGPGGEGDGLGGHFQGRAVGKTEAADDRPADQDAGAGLGGAEGEIGAGLRRAGLNPDWSLTTKTESDGYEWLTDPVVKVGGLNIPVKFVADLILQSNLKSMGKTIDESVKDYFDLKTSALEAWKTLNQPVCLNEEYNVWELKHRF